MKMIRWKTAGCGLLAALTVLMGALSTDAADFFPLDVWEAMTKGPPGSTSIAKPLTAAIRQPMSMPAGATATVPLTFPLDVAEALNHLGGGDAIPSVKPSFRAVQASKNLANPYWLPEELHPMPGRVLTSGASTASMAWK